MINKEASILLKEAIIKKYKDVSLDNLYSDDNEFYYEFKVNDKVSENDFNELEDIMKSINDKYFVKLLRISGVYYEGDSSNEMISRISGKAFDNKEDYDKFLVFLEEAKLKDHRKIGRDLDLFCFSDYVGAGLPLYTPRGVIVKDELQKEVERIC